MRCLLLLLWSLDSIQSWGEKVCSYGLYVCTYFVRWYKYLVWMRLGRYLGACFGVYYPCYLVILVVEGMKESLVVRAGIFSVPEVV